MKQLLTIALLVICSISFGQTNYITIITSPGSWDDGYNVGVQYEYQDRTVYVGPEIFASPVLNATSNYELGYYHVIGRVGVNQNFNPYSEHNNYRFYTGVRMGGIFRTGYSLRPMLGVEAGIDIYITEDIYGRASYTYDMKGDSKIWSQDSSHIVESFLAGVGYKF